MPRVWVGVGVGITAGQVVRERVLREEKIAAALPAQFLTALKDPLVPFARDCQPSHSSISRCSDQRSRVILTGPRLIAASLLFTEFN